ncbi:MAG: DUF2637 domain-containing protein [Pseudonocardiaceae bacterium]|nr:DUF2637 domain-containing protein [Pseudonocardiaceae bacterium]
MTAPVSAAVRRTTVAAVLLVASVAAVVSYAHMQHVAQRSGEGWRSYLLPLSVDGLMVAASMVLLTRRRVGLAGGALAWCALLGGVAASLAANVAAADPTATARLVAAWPAVAFAVAFELLLEQRRPAVTEAATLPVELDRVADLAPAVEPPGPAVAADPVAPLPPVAAPTPVAEPAPVAAAPPPTPPHEPDGLAARAAALLAAADGRPPGRRVLARELGCSEHQARCLLDAATTNGTSTTNGTNGTNGRGGLR